MRTNYYHLNLLIEQLYLLQIPMVKGISSPVEKVKTKKSINEHSQVLDEDTTEDAGFNMDLTLILLTYVVECVPC